MAPEHSRKLLELEARELLRLEANRLLKRIARGSSSAKDEWWFKEITRTGRDTSTVSRESPFQRRYRLARQSRCRLIKKKEASTVEREWCHKLERREDVESVMREMARAHFYKSKPSNLDLESSAAHLHEARNERIEENCASIHILINLNDTAPAVEVEKQPDLQSAAPNSTIPKIHSTINQVIDELFDKNEDINESSIQAIEQSPGFVLLHNLDTLLPNENLTCFV